MLMFETSFVAQECGQCANLNHLLINSYLLSLLTSVVFGLTGLIVG
jgi:hypothetical protein